VRVFLTLFSLIAALSLPGLGVVDAWAEPAETPACHEAAVSQDAPAAHHGAHGSGERPAETPMKAMKVMACCIACVAAQPQPPVGERRMVLRSAVTPRPEAFATGRKTAPEPEPPKA